MKYFNKKDFYNFKFSDGILQNNKKNAFTLAEILAVLVILGIVAAITVPITMKRTTERQNRTKVAKAIAAYDKLVQNFITENELRVSTETLNKLARYNSFSLPPSIASLSKYREGLKPGTAEYNAADDRRTADLNAYNEEIKSGECENIRKYFHVDDFYTGNLDNSYGKCIFKSGGLWWNTYNISSTIIAFKPETLLDSNIDAIAKDYDDNRAFYLTTVQSKETGAYKVNDAYSGNELYFVAIKKDFDYINNKMSPDVNVPCSNSRKTECVLKGNPKHTKTYGLSYFKKDSKGNYAKYLQDCDKYGQNCQQEFNCKSIHRNSNGSIDPNATPNVVECISTNVKQGETPTAKDKADFSIDLYINSYFGQIE